jgi:hypothetical protein
MALAATNGTHSRCFPRVCRHFQSSPSAVDPSVTPSPRDTHEIQVTLPDGARVYVRGIELLQCYQTGRGGDIGHGEYMYYFESPPYTAFPLTKDPADHNCRRIPA